MDHLDRTLTVTLHTRSDAFQDGNDAAETARILRALAARIENQGLPEDTYGWTLSDLNGAATGTVSAVTNP